MLIEIYLLLILVFILFSEVDQVLDQALFHQLYN